MPSTYIFQLADHLYQKRLNYEKAMANGKETGAGQMEHNKAIAALIKNYEATYLTKAEQKQWALFKQHLQQYNSLLTGTNIPGETVLNNSFDKTLSCLNTLSNIQANEGEHLRAGSKALVSGTIITSRFEFTLLVILGAFALALVSAGDKRVFKTTRNPSLN